MVFWFRRRRHKKRKAANDSEAARSAPDTKDKPYIGYRASILKITPAYRKAPRSQDEQPVRDDRRRRDDDRWRKEESRRRPKDGDRRRKDDERRRRDGDRGMRSQKRGASPHVRELVESAPTSTISPAVELPDESTLRPGIGLKPIVPRGAGGSGNTFDELSRKDNSDAASVSTLRIHNWLPELPAPALSRSPTPEPSRAGAYDAKTADVGSTAGAATTVQLDDLHDHLTKDYLAPPDSPPALQRAHADESRWSATTRSSTFTALSSRSSSAAYVSTLRPPPLFRQTQMETLPESRPAV